MGRNIFGFLNLRLHLSGWIEQARGLSLDLVGKLRACMSTLEQPYENGKGLLNSPKLWDFPIHPMWKSQDQKYCSITFFKCQYLCQNKEKLVMV
jgi:hypothetical protein